MKLIEFNSENTISLKSGTARVTMGKNGAVSINKFAVEKLKLKDKSQVKFFQDEEDSACWYIEVVSDKGFEIRRAAEGKDTFIFNNSTLVKKISESTETHYFLIAGQPTELKNRKLFGLIARPKN